MNGDGPLHQGWLLITADHRRLAARSPIATASENQGRALPRIKWNSINSDGALCGSFDRNVRRVQLTLNRHAF